MNDIPETFFTLQHLICCFQFMFAFSPCFWN